MKLCVFSLLFLFFGIPLAGAENHASGTMYDLRHKDYHDSHLGDHYEWSTYGRHYDKVNYGHAFAWDRPGLSAMSLCFEFDRETGGEKYRQLVDDEYCPKLETNYAWDNFIDGQPSRCLKRDVQTDGQRFSRIVDNQRCAKVESVFQWDSTASGEPVCWERDGGTNGSIFRRKADSHLCPTTLDVARAFGKKTPVLIAQPKRAVGNRAPASVEAASDSVSEAPADPKEFWENPEDLVEHVHHASDKIHHR